MPSRILVFDTATLVDMANAFSQTNSSRPELELLVDSFHRQDIWIGFSIVHISELVRTTNETQFLARIGFLRWLPQAALVAGPEGTPGSTDSVAVLEIERFLESENLSRTQITKALRKDNAVWNFIAQPFKNYTIETWQALRLAAQSSVEIERETESIVRADPRGMQKVRLKDVVHDLCLASITFPHLATTRAP